MDKKFLDEEYMHEQLEEYGEIEEFDDGIAWCPYCGYRNELGEVISDMGWQDYYDEEFFCYHCEKAFIADVTIISRCYFTTKRAKNERS